METPTTQGRNGSSSEPAGGESPRLVYLDCSATTPVAPEVLEAMLPFFTERFANASGAYAMGRQARVALETARSRMAGLLGCAPSELVITSGGSESDNLALRGAMQEACEKAGKTLLVAPPALSTDNAAMIAWAGIEKFRLGKADSLEFEPRARWPLTAA